MALMTNTDGGPYQGPGTAGNPPPPAPAPTPPPNVTTDPGYTPNYGNIIKNDPGYLAATNAAQAAEARASAERRAWLRNALIQYGGLPQGFQDQYGDIDQATQDAAAQNQNSTLAQLAAGYGLSEHQLQAQLAARGMLQSGELNYGEDQLNKGFAQQRYDAANSFGAGANQAISGYLGVLDQNRSSLAQAIAQAEANSFNNPAYQPVAPTTAAYDPGLSAQYGKPIYKSGDKLYDIHGNPVSSVALPAGSGGDGTPTTGRNIF